MTTANIKNTDRKSMAEELLRYTRDNLLVNLRFLDSSLALLPFTAYKGSLETDGTKLFYDPDLILRLYRNEQNAPTRYCLHSIFHCVFRHFSVPSWVSDRRLWDLSCDIAAEYTISGIGLKSSFCDRQYRQEKVFPLLLDSIGMITADKIYRYYIKNYPDAEELSQLEDLFSADSHSLWGNADDTLLASWQNVSMRMQVDMETFTRRQGSKAGALMSNLKEANRKVSDYNGFLKKFVTKGDGMKLDPDEFDYTLYSYGMQLSGGKVPLIEQVEYKDSMRIRDICLAVFPGGALSLDKIRLFLLNTWDILHSTESIYSRIRLHVLLPDAGIINSMTGDGGDINISGLTVPMTDHLIISAQEMTDFTADLAFSALNYTDFRLAFNKVSEMSKAKKFKNLRGLIILSGNEGQFPSRMPSFKAAFIFVNNNYSVPRIPSWGIRLVLEEDEI